MGVPFADFIAPGLIIMGMMQNAFANSSFGLLVGKVQGTIVDYLMPPLSTGELLTALTAAAVTRAILVGVAVWLAMLLWPDVHVGVRHFWALIWFGLMGAVLLTLLGLLTSVWRSEAPTSELQSLMRISYAFFCLKKKTIYSKPSAITLHRAVHTQH